MAYIVVEASVRTHRKFLAAGPAAAWLWLCGLGYCQDGLTDGFIRTSAIDEFGIKGAHRLAAKLVQAGLWEPTAAGWLIPGFLDYYQSAAEQREATRRRAEGKRVSKRTYQRRRRAAIRGGGGRLTDAEWQQIVEVFEFKCAYCAAAGLDLTQDHVIPLSRGGLHVASNVVPACRSCNSRKSARTPEEFKATRRVQ